jgi:hypothetical protein
MQSEKIVTKKIDYHFIETISECVEVVEEVLLKQSILSLDCEGIFLSREGQLTLMQVKFYLIKLDWVNRWKSVHF